MSVRPSLTLKIGLFLALPLAGAIAPIPLIARFLDRTRTDSHFMNVAGRQRMLSASMQDSVNMVAVGQEADRADLRDLIAAFDEALAAMERGGDVLGEHLDPPPAEVASPLAAVRALWRRLKPDLASLAERPREEVLLEAYRRARPEIADLRDLSHRVVTVFEERSNRLRAEMLTTLRLIAGLIGLIFLAGLLLARRCILRPVLAMEDMARRISAGDFSRRIQVSTTDELASLARSFNDMTSQVQGLLTESDLLTRDATEKGRRYHEIMENAIDAIVVMGQDGRISYVNGAAERMFGYERPEMIGRPVTMLMPERYRQAHQRGVRRYVETGQPRIMGRVISLHGLRRDGETFPLELSISSHREGAEFVFTAIIRDVTERSRTEEALRSLVEGTAASTGEDFFRLLAQNLARAMETEYALVTRLPGSASGFTRTLAFWAGRDFAENRDIPLAGTPCGKVLSGEDGCYPDGLGRLFPGLRDIVGPGMESYLGVPLLNSRKQVIGHLAVMDRKPMAEGRQRRVSVLRIFGARAGAELDRLMAGEALAERELQLRQAQKLDAIGKLAGGIAHDFNNLMTAILGFCAFLLQNLKPDDPNRADVLGIEAAGKRAAVLTNQLLAFSRKQTLRPSILDLNSVVQEIRSMLRRLIGEDIALSFRPSDQPAVVRADRGQIEQVIMNLVLNARDAMPKGGEIIIETSAVELGEDLVHRRGRIAPGSYVTLTFSDTGAGMSPEVQEHLFEPFFTTKEVGKGTGLGLPTVYGIIAQSGGHITVYSEEGHGSTFKIYLPKAGERSGNGVPPPPKKDIPRGEGAVLLVEDEPAVLELARRILTQSGFTVIAASDPLEALALCESRQEPIRLLVTDMVMPKLNGLEVARKVRAARPGTPVLYMSGYTEHPVLAPDAGDLKSAFLQKPFEPSAFLEKIHELLGA